MPSPLMSIICYNSGGNVVVQWTVQLPCNAMIAGLNLFWQATSAMLVYTGGKGSM